MTAKDLDRAENKKAVKPDLITTATPKMVPALKKLWQLCFGDEKSYIDFYFKHRFEPENTIVYLKDSKPVSMLTLLPAKLRSGSEFVPVRYVYAVATHPEHRRQGFAAKLLEYVNDEKRQRDYAGTLLVPASEELFSYYEKLGYHTACYLKTASYTMVELDGLLTDTTQEAFDDFIQYPLMTIDYCVLRNELLGAHSFVSWDEKALSYVLEEHQLCGGQAIKLIDDYDAHCILFSVVEKEIIVKEIVAKEDKITAILKYLLKFYNCERITVNMPEFTPISADIKPFAMVTESLKNGQFYFNLALN